MVFVCTLFRIEELLRFALKLACRYLKQLSRNVCFPQSGHPMPPKKAILGHLRQMYGFLQFSSDLNKIYIALKKTMVHKTTFTLFDWTTPGGSGDQVSSTLTGVFFNKRKEVAGRIYRVFQN